MRVPFLKEMRIGAYIFKQKLLGHKRYPLVLMLEPLFRCNLACAGCGKIQFPAEILRRQLTPEQCWIDDRYRSVGKGISTRRRSRSENTAPFARSRWRGGRYA